MYMSDLKFAEVKPGIRFHSYKTLYLGYGKRSGKPAFYAGTTTRGLHKRHSEHKTGSQDRRYEFELEGYLAWELPKAWRTTPTASEYALIEDLLMYSLCRTLHDTDYWLDNRRFNTKIRNMTYEQVSEVLSFMQNSVYPKIEKRFGIKIDPEPMPQQKGEKFWVYVNGTRGAGPRSECVKSLYAKAGWIYNKAC